MPILIPAAALLLAACQTTTTAPADPRAVHDRALTLDTHLDTPAQMDDPAWSIRDRHSYSADGSQIDLPRMAEGGLDGGFWVIYTPSGPTTPAGYAAARAHAERRLANIQRMVRDNPDSFAFATTAADAARIVAAGKRVVYISIENSLPLGEDLSQLSRWYDAGVRMAGPVHSADNQLADSTTGQGRWGGLSPLGRQWVAEMNRLGMIVDGSHSSDAAFDQMLALSTTPIILSHSGPKAIYDHPRNIDDARIRALAAKGGVIQANALFLSDWSIGQTRRPEAERTGTPADFELFMRSLLHLIEVAGVDHVGIGCDWDGGGGVLGMEDVAALPKITERLLAAGYTPADVEKIWSGNVLRLLAQAEAARGR
ncbi:membrane dipeptidase [Sphingomonas jejuensis]|uniref:Membrane dipeptidase n=1 Tax=Sphingomonas jejuensis TaxID=904715 RepID=A0ABX0XPW5_9SPHN|nr:dipeptidase [Sphingomonas jejuensis]NJC34897.1 membrane dipeptidase [Sphingomonas jejuensis]